MQPKTGFASVPSSCRLLPSQKAENWAPPKGQTAREAMRLFSRFVFSVPFLFARNFIFGAEANISARDEVRRSQQNFSPVSALGLQRMITFKLKVPARPCIRLARGNFELTNQDSAGGKKFTVLTSMSVDLKGIEIKQLFSLEIALNIHYRGFTIPKTISHCKKWKMWNILCLKASNLATNSGSSSVAM